MGDAYIMRLFCPYIGLRERENALQLMSMFAEAQANLSVLQFDTAVGSLSVFQSISCRYQLPSREDVFENVTFMSLCPLTPVTHENDPVAAVDNEVKDPCNNLPKHYKTQKTAIRKLRALFVAITSN